MFPICFFREHEIEIKVILLVVLYGPFVECCFNYLGVGYELVYFHLVVQQFL